MHRPSLALLRWMPLGAMVLIGMLWPTPLGVLPAVRVGIAAQVLLEKWQPAALLRLATDTNRIRVELPQR